MAFFRIIEYKDDKPVGIVKDHYKNGIVQMEAAFLADRPTEVMDGVIIFYDTQGKKEKESEKSFADENSWRGLNDKARKLYGEGVHTHAKQRIVYFEIQNSTSFGRGIAKFYIEGTQKTIKL